MNNHSAAVKVIEVMNKAIEDFSKEIEAESNKTPKDEIESKLWPIWKIAMLGSFREGFMKGFAAQIPDDDRGPG